MDTEFLITFPDKVTVLGEPYYIVQENAGDSPMFDITGDTTGLCSTETKEIFLCNILSLSRYKNASADSATAMMKLTLRHEIVHAFLYESGLDASSMMNSNVGWAVNEEIVDWIALQGAKIYKAWSEVGAL